MLLNTTKMSEGESMKKKVAICTLAFLLLVGCSNSGKKYNEAQSLASEEKYDEAVSVLQEIPKYKDSGTLIDEYNKRKISKDAQELYDKKSYDECIELLENNEIKEELYKKACIERADELANGNMYEKAILYLKKLPDDKDAENKILEYSQTIVYNNGIKAMGSGDLEAAIGIFQSLPDDFKDTEQFLKLCKDNIIYIGLWEAADRSQFYKDGMYITEGVGVSVDLKISINGSGKLYGIANGAPASFNENKIKWIVDDYTYEMNLSASDVTQYKPSNPGFQIITKLVKPIKYAKYLYTEEVTDNQTRALKTANEYLSVLNFSKSGLANQLIHDGFTNEEANYAVDNLTIDWDEQAYETAQTYLQLISFDAWDLEEQLMHDGFTEVQARNAVKKCGLR